MLNSDGEWKSTSQVAANHNWTEATICDISLKLLVDVDSHESFVLDKEYFYHSKNNLAQCLSSTKYESARHHLRPVNLVGQKPQR